MQSFENVHFHGKFRDYQARVLSNVQRHLADGKVNIVAAPGSGKTVLGLELIRLLGAPCLIFSPTTAIREQWGERFREMFLDKDEDFDKLYSSDLHEIKLLNSVTYQALFTAMENISVTDDGDDDFSDIDLVREIKNNHIGTICLDEAHHLKNEWHKSLEKLLKLVEGDVKIIALTATPPYDSQSSEWQRYISMCGEVDEEIFVPELVSKDTLCPHQDYVYFNFPTEAELTALKAYREEALQAVSAVGNFDYMRTLCQRLCRERNYDELFGSAKEYIALFVLFEHYGYEIDNKLFDELLAGGVKPKFKLAFAQTALDFLLSSELLNESEREHLIAVLKAHGVYHKRKLSLELDDRLKRELVSSVGKLSSIEKIAQSEFAALGKKLRMLVLTDYIEKETLPLVGSDADFSSVSVVSIFETLRRSLHNADIAVLSGSLLILPEGVDLGDVKYRSSPLAGTGYAVYDFSCPLAQTVKLVGELFDKGAIQVLVGTKSLLGEGWDAPCINSLILASFVGSFVLSNQMRGRAIRVDRNVPDKTANIWHLVTVEPPFIFEDKAVKRAAAQLDYDKNELISYDFEVLKRRFDSFMGPSYETGEIESGIERISAIKPPYDKRGIERINEAMLAKSANRAQMREAWQGEVKDAHFGVVLENEVPREKRVPVFTYFNALTVLLLTLLEYLCIRTFALELGSSLLAVVSTAVVLTLAFTVIKKIILHLDPARSVKTLGLAVYRTLVDCGLVAPACKVETSAQRDNTAVSLYLRNASIRDQDVFNTAMAELLSPIENPRYLLIRKYKLFGYDYRQSYACPSCIGRKKEFAELLGKNLEHSTGHFVLLYTRNEGGRQLILKCRRLSYITENYKLIDRKYKVRHWE